MSTRKTMSEKAKHRNEPLDEPKPKRDQQPRAPIEFVAPYPLENALSGEKKKCKRVE